MQHKTLEAKATITDLGEFTALAAAFTVDRMNERILPGAFKGTIGRWQESGKQIPLHWDHSGDAQNIIGTVDPSSMNETEEGLEVKGKLDLEDSEVAREAWRSMKKNRIGLSFGYLVTDDGEGDDGIRELKAVDLFEVSVTPAPANPDTRFIDMKSTTAGTDAPITVTYDDLTDHRFTAVASSDTSVSADGNAVWEKWAAEHIVEDPKLEDSKAIEDARDEEPETAKSEAQDPLRKRYDELALELSTRGIDVSEPPKVEEKPSDDPPSMEQLRRKNYDLMLEIQIGSENQ